ncbi:MAG: ABC transporter permease [Leptospiraceae bacterium]|nr:ABC transporter permease [Leptospiraceae bacterium]
MGTTSTVELLPIQKTGDTITIRLTKTLNSDIVAANWDRVNEFLKENSEYKKILVNAEELLICEGIGVGLVYDIKRKAKINNAEFTITGLKTEFQKLLSIYDKSDYDLGTENIEVELNQVEEIGLKLENNIEETKNIISFIGETFIGFLKSILNPTEIRWSEVWKVAEATGVRALFITGLIGFLLGLIMSFQSAIPMQRFGAEIFVANLVALSLFRELGPLMTAIILAGRSGSSFAAELGTMKVSEELDALNTMGLSAVQFLIIPRLIAAMLMTPILTLFFNFFGLVGSAIVVMSFGYPFVTFTNQIAKAVAYRDLGSGLFKSLVFGLLVAGIGCLAGMRTKEGASAVGESTTLSVVAGIITICVMDGVFSVLFYYIGI